MTFGCGKSVQGVGSVFAGFEYPFLNFFKGVFETGFAFADVNNDQYPAVGTLSENINGFLNLPISYTGHWVMKFSGSGSIGFFNFFDITTVVVTSGSFNIGGIGSILSGTNARVEFFFNGVVSQAQVQVQFPTSGTYSGMSNAILVRVGDESALDAAIAAGRPYEFNPDYVKLLQTLNPGILRFLGFNNVNDSNNFARHSYRTPLTSFSYLSGRAQTTAQVGTITRTGTDAYTCGASADMSSLTNLVPFQGVVNAANTTATPTISFNGGPAKTITLPFVPGGGLAAGDLAAGNVTMVYDIDLDKVIVFTAAFGQLTAYMPIEACVALCNKVGAHLWFNIPHLFDDTSVTQVSSYVRDHLNSGLNAYFEYSNEIWNFADQQTAWANAKGAALGIGGFNDFYGLRTRQMMGNITSVWTGIISPGLRRVMGNFLLADNSIGGGVQTQRWNGANLASFGFNTAPNRPIDFCDVVSYAPYYSGAQDGPFFNEATGGDSINATTQGDLLTNADLYATGTPSSQATALAWLDNDIRRGKLVGGGSSGNTTLDVLQTKETGNVASGWYATWEALTATYSGKTIECYEGGFEGWFPSTTACTNAGISTTYGGSTGKIANLVNAYKQTGMFRALVADQFTQFMATAHAKAPAWLQLENDPLSPSQFALLQGDLYGASFKSLDAVTAFNPPCSQGIMLLGQSCT